MALEKKKYYDEDQVKALLENVKKRADSTSQENAELKSQLDSLNSQRTEIGDTLLSAKSLARRVLEKARRQAEEIVREANDQAAVILREANEQAEAIRAEARREVEKTALQTQQEHAVRCVESCISQMKQQHMDAIETLNAQWQQFLCELTVSEEDGKTPNDEVPADLEDKVGAIAREMQGIGGE